MPIYDKLSITQQAKTLGVVRDTLEKVSRLQEILRFFSSSKLLRTSLALKGGTAINLLFFNLPRLSVDIDLDFCRNIPKSEMFFEREKIQNLISKYMLSQGYTVNPHSKSPHSLDSFVYDYINSAGMKDNVKIEINYSLREHILPVQSIGFGAECLQNDFKVTAVAPIEIYAAKTVALLTRAAARDLYDMNYMIRYGLFDEEETQKYRKCVVFYLAIATIAPPETIHFDAIDTITAHKIHTDLYPVIRDRDSFELNSAKESVKHYLESVLVLSENEKLFLSKFRKGFYCPELIFDDEEVVSKLKKHPMAMWKTNRIKDIVEL